MSETPCCPKCACEMQEIRNSLYMCDQCGGFFVWIKDASIEFQDYAIKDSTGEGK